VRHAAKVDGNHAEIVKRFRQYGWSVLSLAAIGKGCPDLLASRGATMFLVEVKMPKGKTNALQRLWHSTWNGPVVVVRSVEDVDALVANGKPRVVRI